MLCPHPHTQHRKGLKRMDKGKPLSICRRDLISINPLSGREPWERSGLVETRGFGEICCNRARGSIEVGA